MGLNFLMHVMMLGSHSFRRAFGIWRKYPLSADTRWPFSEFGRGQPHYASCRDIARYSLTSVSCKFLSQCRWPGCSVTNTRTKSASLLYIWPRNSQDLSTELDELLVVWSYFNSMYLEPRARHKGVMMSFSSMQYFHWDFYLIYQSEFECLAGCMRRRVWQDVSSHEWL